ncbi:restriction endonuclease [Vibrio alfacsensis]|uniref:restriction endonuclease n=1 Tax=Vibrio TaxID=662 RepID=UPI00406818E7
MNEKQDISDVAGHVGTFVWLLFLVIWWFTDTSFLWMAGIGFVSGVLVVMTIQVVFEEEKKEKEEQNRQTVLNIVAESVESHLEVLIRKRRTLVRTGDYGELIDGDWHRELKKFLKVTIPPNVYELVPCDDDELMEVLIEYVDALVVGNLNILSSELDSIDVNSLDGVEYEAYCAQILEAVGWDVVRTPQTGDHGVDLIAQKNGRRVAIQCKRYSTPVGNKAVQEAYSGMSFYDANEAIVVSNAPFTKAANQLAGKLSVSLFHNTQLSAL